MNFLKTSLLICLLLPQFVSAGVFELVTITNDEDSEVTKFLLVTDKDNKEITAFHKDTYSGKNYKLRRHTVQVAQIRASEGIILDQRDGRIIVALKSDNFATHNGGNLEVDTLYNGITGKRKSYDLELVRAGKGWDLERWNRKISKMHLKSKKVPFVGTVGIADLRTR